MRANWIFHLTLLAIVSGCATSGVQQPVPPLGAKQTSWTDKVTPPFKGSLRRRKSRLRWPSPSRRDKTPSHWDLLAVQPRRHSMFSMGQLSDQGGNVSHARSMYQKVLSLDPKKLDAALGLLVSKIVKATCKSHCSFISKPSRNIPKTLGRRTIWRCAMLGAGQMQNSLELLDKVVRMKPDKQLYRNNIAKVLIELNRYDTAVSHLSAVYEPAVANYNMAILLQERGRTPEALYFARAALAAKSSAHRSQHVAREFDRRFTCRRRRRDSCTYGVVANHRISTDSIGRIHGGKTSDCRQRRHYADALCSCGFRSRIVLLPVDRCSSNDSQAAGRSCSNRVGTRRLRADAVSSGPVAFRCSGNRRLRDALRLYHSFRPLSATLGNYTQSPVGKTAETVPRKRLAGKLLAIDGATPTSWADHQANGVFDLG